MKKFSLLPLLLLIFTVAANFPATAAAMPPGGEAAAASSTYFSIGTGGSDVIPHQIVRANDDHLYIFANQQSSGVVRAYRTTGTGLPDSASAFAAPVQITETSNPIGIDAVYDGGNYIHVIMNLQNGSIKDYPFEVSTHSFKAGILLASNGGTVIYNSYVGTSGAAGMQDTSGRLHLVYWTNGNHILHRAYTYNGSTNTLTPVTGFMQVDTAGSANHPAVAVSPLDNSVTVAWVSQADNPVKIRTRTRSSSGAWGTVQSASTAPVWTDTVSGINIDQGPSLIIDPGGVRHLTYIQSFDASSGDYGRIHYVRDAGSGWVDQALSSFSHDPALAINSAGEIYIIGHGHPKSPACLSMDDICTIKKNSNGTWANPVLFAAHPGVTSFDSSPSVKWSVVGFNRPETIEFIFFSTPYSTPTLYYGRLQGSGAPSAPVISGNAGTAGAKLNYTDGTPKTAVSNSSGYYSFTVSPGWSGTVTPSKPGYWFTPINRSYTNVQTNQTLQNYISSNLWAGGVIIEADRNVVAVGRPHIGEEVASYNGFPSGGTVSYLPMLFKDAFGGDYDAAFYVQNVDAAQTAAITIKFYDSAGALTCTLPDTLAPRASRGYWLPDQACLPAGWVGSAMVTSDLPVVTVGRPHIGAQIMTYNGIGTGSLSSYLPMLFKHAYGGAYDSAYYIENVDETQTASVTVQYYDNNGMLTCTKPAESFPPRAARGIWVPDEACLPDGWVGGAVIISDQPIVTLGRPHIGAEIMTYNGFSSGGSRTYLPMLFKDAFGGAYDAAFYVQNVDASGTASLSIKFYDSAGSLTCTATDTIAPRASRGYWVPGQTCLPAGWVGGAVVTSDQPIVAVGRPHIGAQVTAYGGVQAGAGKAYLPMLFKNMWGAYNSAFYIQNVDAAGPATVTVKFYDMDGNLNCTRTDVIPALASLGYWVPAVTCMP